MFIFERSEVKSSPDSAVRKARVDSKGRISVPSDIRRSMGLVRGSEVLLDSDLFRNMIVLTPQPGSSQSGKPDNGQGGVTGCIRDCGSLGPGSTPGPGPRERIEI